jgi:DNA-binding transcriptional ArsR family regulator
VFLPPRDDTHNVVSERLLPLSDQDARELLAAAPSKLHDNVLSWLVRDAQGVPGVLVEGARILSGRRKDVSNFASEMGKEAERSVREILNDDEIKKLQLLSLLKKVGVKKSAFADIVAICKSFGTKRVFDSDIDPSSVVAALPKLEGLGIVRSKGLCVEIQSQFLANRFAKKLIRLHKNEFIKLFRALDLNGQLQLLGRLQGIGPDFDSHWKFLFRNKESIKGPLCDFQTALHNSPFLYPVACAQPERISRLIDSGLRGATAEARKTITGNARSGLVRALEELLFHRETSVTAILNLGLLAEAEVENYANNATGIFCSYFFPVHPQASWSFGERLEALDRILSSDNSDELRRVGITAIESSLHHMAHPIIEHASDAAKPLEPPFEHLELHYLDYLEDLIDILMKIAGMKMKLC